MLFFYKLFIRFSRMGIGLAALFNPKARQWVEGRQEWAAELNKGVNGLNRKNRPLLWIHCASLGEFEQGRPLMEAIKKKYPDYMILLTFFSPSGYEIRKNYALADHVAYLPLDTRNNAIRFLDVARPDLVVFVKYEFWYYHLEAVQKRQIPLLLISALFRPQQLFFKPWGEPFRRLLAGFSHLFVQNQSSADQLETLRLTQYTIAGDTRVDRVYALSKQVKSFPVVARFSKAHPVLVVGSSWPPDEALLIPLLNEQLPEDWKVIIAPHQIKESGLRDLEDQLQLPVIRYSTAELANVDEYRVLIIDNIGMLSSLYQYGRLAYIGGGFGTGIHNTLEPIAFDLPVLFGPRYKKFEEAVQLVRRGGAFPVNNKTELIDRFRDLLDEAAYDRAAQEAWQYLEANRGATAKILAYVEALQKD